MLDLANLKKTFNPGTPNETRALQGVDLHLDQGDFLVILGGNGSGKSTLMNALSGCFPLDGGSVRLAGEDITRWEEHERAALIGRVFQNPFAGTAPGMSIAENFAIASKRGRRRRLRQALSRRFRSEIAARIAVLRMGLEQRLNAPIGTLSGGQRQALTLLMATWLKPALLLLDEHTAALDPKSAEQVIRLTKDIVCAEGLTTLMVTHSMQQAVNLGNRLIIMHRGRVMREYAGPEKQRLRADDLLAAFDDLRRREMLDESAMEMLRKMYV